MLHDDDIGIVAMLIWGTLLIVGLLLWASWHIPMLGLTVLGFTVSYVAVYWGVKLYVRRQRELQEAIEKMREGL